MFLSDNLLLTLLWAIPVAGALLVLLMPKESVALIKMVALATTAFTFLLTVWAFLMYVTGNPAPSSVPLAERALANRLDQPAAAPGGPSVPTDGPTRDLSALATEAHDQPNDLVTRQAWIPYFNIQYFLGVDGISMSLLLLTGLISLLACYASWNIDKQVKGYFSLYLILVASMMGVFLSLDMFLFFVFFEIMLLPMYFLIAIWGGDNREYAAIKFLLYTLFGSVFILVAILVLYFFPGQTTPMVDGKLFAAHSFDAVFVAQAASQTSYYDHNVQYLIFGLFFVGFLVKLPSFPFHTWLPDAHVQAPTPISMILAGVLLKIGGYGLIRLAWPLAPAGAYAWAPIASALGVFSIIYGALAAMAQTDFKKLVAYSSVSHMGYVTLGMAAMAFFAGDGTKLDPRYYAYGVNGAMYMMLAHGITSAGMFFLVGVIYDRAHTRDLTKLGGLWTTMPLYAFVGLIIFFGSMGLPGLCGFIAEVFVVLSAFNYNKLLAVLAALAVILTAGYILWTIQRVWLGRNEHWRSLPDLNTRELIIAAPLVVLTIIMGVFPQLILGWMSPSVEQVVQQIVNAPTVRAEMEPAARRPIALGDVVPSSR
jgi:NADH-quinone oxidoreductase subunit M